MTYAPKMKHANRVRKPHDQNIFGLLKRFSIRINFGYVKIGVLLNCHNEYSIIPINPNFFLLCFFCEKNQLDESTNYLYRTVHIHITQAQLDELRKSNDPIIIDGLISKILAQTEFGTIQLVKEYTVDMATTIWSHLPSFKIPTDSEFIFNTLPRSRPIFINFAVIVLTYFLCRRFHINYFVVVFFGLAYCLYEYLDAECHKVSR